MPTGLIANLRRFKSMDINELRGWGISQQIAQIVENGFTFEEEIG